MTNTEINFAIAQMCGISESQTPDYCSDLNAMFEAERYLLGHDPDNYYKYATEIDRNHSPEWLVHVAARQRALCLLRIFGKR
jgi:hypothetical protein